MDTAESSCSKEVFGESVWIYPLVCRGRCPHRPAGKLPNSPRVYLKTHDVTGSEGFCVAQDIFFAGILTYFKGKMTRRTAKRARCPGALEFSDTPKIPAETVRSAGSMWASTPTINSEKPADSHRTIAFRNYLLRPLRRSRASASRAGAYHAYSVSHPAVSSPPVLSAYRRRSVPPFGRQAAACAAGRSAAGVDEAV